MRIRLEEFWRHGYYVFGEDVGLGVVIFRTKDVEGIDDKKGRNHRNGPSRDDCLKANLPHVKGRLDEETLTNCHAKWPIIRG